MSGEDLSIAYNMMNDITCLCQLAFPAVLSSRLFQLSVVVFGISSPNTVLFRSLKSDSAYSERRAALASASAFFDRRFGVLFLLPLTGKVEAAEGTAELGLSKLLPSCALGRVSVVIGVMLIVCFVGQLLTTWKSGVRETHSFEGRSSGVSAGNLDFIRDFKGELVGTVGRLIGFRELRGSLLNKFRGVNSHEYVFDWWK
jgi:hypothetical protein